MEDKNLGNDMMELAKVWNNLSDDMQQLLAKAISGEEYVEGTNGLLKELGSINSIDYENKPLLLSSLIGIEGLELINRRDPVLSIEQVTTFIDIADGMNNLVKSIKESIINVKKYDNDLKDLKKNDKEEN